MCELFVHFALHRLHKLMRLQELTRQLQKSALPLAKLIFGLELKKEPLFRIGCVTLMQPA